jgi:serine/threonine-protein kinase
MAAESTVPSFPTYAELTQTHGWAATLPATIVASDTAPIAGARYTEGAVLGVGGMGKVLLAHDARIGRDVAVKVLHGERELSVDDRARFLREAKVQGQLEHPSIVPVYDIDQRPDGSTFFTMRRVLGRTLGAILDDLRSGVPTATARYTQRELLTAFATVCLTLDYAHSRGVIHRDLKPANIMLGDFGEVYVLDWGLARLVDHVEPSAAPAARISVPGEMMGTPLYMAPEQMGDPDVGAPADVFSLGAILFEILTLERARDPRALFAPVDARPSTRTPDLRVAPELETICVKATEHDPVDRFPTPRALHDALVRYLEGDRELEHRRQLSAQYAGEATAALARADEQGADMEQERTTAIRKLRHALALDPNNADNIKVLAALITTPPKLMPREVAAELEAQEAELVATGARYSIVASLAWFTFLPLVLWIGIRPGHAYQAVLILGPAALAALLSAYARTRTSYPLPLQLSVIALTIGGGAASTTMFGPLMMVPTLLATFTIVIQAHPRRFIRGATWALGCIALTAVSIVELVAPHSYVQAGEGLLILPSLHALPRNASIILLLTTSLGMTIVPCLFIGRIRQALNEAQRQILVQAWQFRRFGEDLITTRTRP